MRKLWTLGLILVLLTGLAACRPRSTPTPVPGIFSPTPEVRPTIPLPTPMPALPGPGSPVPEDVERISSHNTDRLVPIWRAQWLLFRDIRTGTDMHVALTPGGLALLSAADLKTIRFIPLPADTEFPTAFAVRSDQKAAVVGTRDGTLRVVDLTTGEIQAETRMPMEIRSLAFLDAEGRQVVMLADSLRTWEIGRPISPPVAGFPQKDYGGALTENGQLALAVDSMGRGSVWDVLAGKVVLTFTLPMTRPTAVALHPQGRYALVGKGDDVLVLRLDLVEGHSEIIRRMKYFDVEELEATESYMVIRARPGGANQVLVFPWDQEEHVLHLHGDRPSTRVHLDERRRQLYLLSLNRLEVISLDNREQIQRRYDLPTSRAVPIWKDRLLVLAGPSSYADIVVLNLKTGLARYTEARGPIESLWADPNGRWIAAGIRGGSLHFMDLELRTLGYVETQSVKWIGRDAQGRGLIGIGHSEVLLGAVGQEKPLWRRALPVSLRSRLIGAVSPEWIAVTTQFEGDTIWLLDHEGNIRHTIRKPEFAGEIQDLEWSSNFLVVHLRASGPRGFAHVLHVPDGQLLARLDLDDPLARARWWPDRNLALIEIPTKRLDIAWPGPPMRSFTLDDRKDARITGIWRIPDTGQFLAIVQRVRAVRSERQVTFWFFRGGWLRAFDVDARRLIWEKPLSYSPVWMEVDPEGKWVILGGAEGVMEIWGVR